MCDCRLCQRSEKIRALLEEYPFKKEDREWLRGMFNLLYETEADLEYKNCVLHGDWPSSVEQLERALEIAKDKRAKLTA